MSSRLNLAKDPFLNRKPVQRFQWILWILGTVLLALNVSSYLQNRTDTTELRARSRGLEEEIELLDSFRLRRSCVFGSQTRILYSRSRFVKTSRFPSRESSASTSSPAPVVTATGSPPSLDTRHRLRASARSDE